MNTITLMKALCIVGIVFTAILLVRSIPKIRSTEEGQARWEKEKKHFAFNSVVAFIANFLDVLGIGSYATSTGAYKIKGSVDDMYIPGTLNVGDTIPVLLEAFLFFGFVEIDKLTLISLLLAMIVGSKVGASLVSKMDAEKIRLGMGIGLLVVGVVMALKQLQIGPFGLVGMETGIYGIKLIISVIVEFFVGAFMTIGVGAYAPTFALVSMMGMNVQSAFPIMMGGCAFLMTFGAGPEFIKSGRYDMIATLTNATFGSLGALIAYMFVKSVPLTILLWIVVAVVFYTAIMFIRDYMKSREPKKAAKSVPAKAE